MTRATPTGARSPLTRTRHPRATGGGTAALTAEITAAVADGRLSKHLEGWLVDLTAKDPEAARAYLEKAVPVAALTGMQTRGAGFTPPAPGAGTAALSAEEAEAAKLLGMSIADFAKCKEGNV